MHEGKQHTVRGPADVERKLARIDAVVGRLRDDPELRASPEGGAVTANLERKLRRLRCNVQHLWWAFGLMALMGAVLENSPWT